MKMLKGLWMLVLAIFFVLTIAVQVEAVTCAGRKCPSKPLVSDIYQDWHGVLIKDSAPIFTNMSSQGNASNTNNKIMNKFGMLVYIYAIEPMPSDANQDSIGGNTLDKAKFLLVGDASKKGRHLGWVARENILLNKNALRAPGGIYKKVLPANNYNESNIAQAAPFYADPDFQARVNDQSELFAPWFVYKQECYSNGKSNCDASDWQRDANVWYLIGENQNWDSEKWIGDHSMIAGWVNKQMTYSWNTRLGMEWDKSTFSKRSPAAIFQSANDVQKFYNGDTSVQIRGNEKNSSEELKYFDPRFPILDARPIRTRKFSMKTFNTGFPGDIVVSGSSSNEPIIGSDQNLAKVVEIFNQARSATQDVDVLFVMDHTTSMDNSFAGASYAVQKFMKSMAEGWLQDRVKFALATYRDVTEGRYAHKMWVNFNDVKGGETFKLLEHLKNAENTCGDKNDKDYPEAMLEGIANAIQTAQWRGGSNRFVIVVGDHGNRSNENWCNAKGLPDSNFQNLLANKKLNLYMVRVHNSGPPWDKQDAYERFGRQAAYLSQNSKYPAHYFSQKTNSKVSADLVNILSGIAESVKKSVGLLDCLRSGGDLVKCQGREGQKLPPNDSRGFSAQAGRESEMVLSDKQVKLIVDKLRDQGISLQDIRNLGEVVQICETGWIGQKDLRGNKQARIMLYVAKTPLFEFQGFLTHLVRLIGQHEEEHLTQSLPTLLQESLKLQTGDSPEENESFSAFCSKRMAVDVQSPLLTKNPNDLREVCQSRPEECRKLIKSIQRSREYLAGVIGNNKMKENSNGMPETVKDKNGEIVTQKYWRVTKAGYEWAWIPWAYFP